MNSKAILTIATAGAALSICAAVPAPQVSDVSMTQGANGDATITYSLSSASAVITLDIQTNATGGAWASIGGRAVSGARGDVWKVVATGSHRIRWSATTCWADHQIPASGIRAVVTAWALDNTPDYMAVDISGGAQQNTQNYYPSADFVPGGVTSDIYKTTMLLMRKIMAKDVRWTMGSTAQETQRDPYSPEMTHQVTLTNNYYIGVYEVTQAQWSLVQPSRPDPSYFKNPDDCAMRPVQLVCYNEIRNSNNSTTVDTSHDWPNPPNDNSFLGKLHTKTGIVFDLPSEAQWEFACRAGNGSTKWGDGSAILNRNPDANLELLGRYQNNGGKVWNGTTYVFPDAMCGATNGTAIVGSYAPNDWGIYDMHGNVLEWCLDWCDYDITALGGMVNIDPADSTKSLSAKVGGDAASRIMRGGSITAEAAGCRSAKRYWFSPAMRNEIFGFRVVCTAGLR